ncbi:MAG: hypothetical protein ACTS80_00820 [Candidatus Hodgkinia cicadicola]
MGVNNNISHVKGNVNRELNGSRSLRGRPELNIVRGRRRLREPSFGSVKPKRLANVRRKPAFR